MRGAMVLSDSELLAVAKRLAQAAGWAPPIALERLEGGRNNRVFKVAVAGGPPLFLKSYFSHPHDTRQRLAAEWRFLTYAWCRGIRTVPKPLAADWETHTGLYGFIRGRRLKPGEVFSSHVEAAAGFILALNASRRDIGTLPPGSEACFSLAQHIATIEGRVARLGSIDPNAPHRDRVERFARATLMPIWREVRARIAQEAARSGIALEAGLAVEETIVSPSDFGFHNVLIDDEERVVFTDFEYAGRDDPAKLVCDFFCQPEVPVPLEYYERFVAKVSRGLELGPVHEQRCRLLLDAYRVKWTCIILNDFQLVGTAQRAFARGNCWAERCEAQLAKAEAKIGEVTTV